MAPKIDAVFAQNERRTRIGPGALRGIIFSRFWIDFWGHFEVLFGEVLGPFLQIHANTCFTCFCTRVCADTRKYAQKYIHADTHK